MTECANIPWLSDSKFNLEKVKEAQGKDPIISCFIALKETGNKPDWNDVAAQENELMSYWAQLESMLINSEGLLCQQLIGPRSSITMQVVIPLSLVETILEMLHESVTAGQMGARRMLACARMRFYWYKQRESIELWCNGCAKCTT